MCNVWKYKINLLIRLNTQNKEKWYYYNDEKLKIIINRRLFLDDTTFRISFLIWFLTRVIEQEIVLNDSTGFFGKIFF